MPPRSTLLWALRAGWLALPATTAPLLGAALADRSAAVAAVLEVMLWLAWATALVAVLVPRTVGLVVVRIAAATSLAVVSWAALWVTGDDPGALLTGAALGTACLVTVLALAPQTGARFVNGSAYGDEGRHLLRPPAPLLLGPIPLAAVVVAVGIAGGPLLLAARQWVAGAASLCLGGPAALAAGRALHALAQRWLVFVPAGVVVKDHLVLVDPVLFRRRVIESLAAAEAGTDADDLTAGAPGLAIELRLREDVPVVRTGRRRNQGEPGAVRSLLVVPTRPGAVTAEASRRRYPTS